MDYDLENNLNPEFPDMLKVKLDTIETCIKIMEEERDAKLKALESMDFPDTPVRKETLVHYHDAIEVFVDSMTTLLRSIIEEAKGFKSDDSSPDITI
jgi:hypothetical protein